MVPTVIYMVWMFVMAGVKGDTHFVRWGRKDCPSGVSASTVYSGIVGGSYYTHGGGSEYLCLPLDPEPINKQFQTSYTSFLYGAEYEEIPGMMNKDVPCVVCDTSGYSMSMVIAARQSCYTGWTKAYNGFLASSYRSHKRSTYICVDADAEDTGSSGSLYNRDGKLIYPVKTVCGSLPCEPYKQYEQVGCVVCLK